MSKQLQKLNYSPVEVEISVIGSSTPTTGSLTITQIKTLLASDQNYIKYTINTTTSEYLYFTNFTNNTAFYGADLYNATTSVYYRHLIKISYSSDLSSATWNYYNIPVITGSSSDLQEKLVSGTNIKTINGNSVLGSGNLAISEFPERSEVDATLSQIAGVNSQGHPDVGKVAAGNISSAGATQGQVPVADGSGGVAWGNKQDTLTASSVNDGTIAKAIGFDSSNNLVKGTVGGGFTVLFVKTYTGSGGSSMWQVTYANGVQKQETAGGGKKLENVVMLSRTSSQSGYTHSFDTIQLNCPLICIDLNNLAIKSMSTGDLVTNKEVYILRGDLTINQNKL